MTAQAQTAQPAWREWLALAALTVPIFMLATDMTVLFLVLPAIAADLGPGATQQLWTLHISDLLSAGLVLTAGTFADRLGPKRLLLFGMAAYGAISMIAAFAPNAETLILARGLIAVAAVTIGPATMVLLRHMFPSRRQFATANPAATVGEIAKAVGTARSTVHRHFAKRTDLVCALQAYAEEQLAEQGQERVHTRKPEPKSSPGFVRNTSTEATF